MAMRHICNMLIRGSIPLWGLRHSFVAIGRRSINLLKTQVVRESHSAGSNPVTNAFPYASRIPVVSSTLQI